MSDVPQGEGWWQASDGKYYPPAQPAGEPTAQDAPAGVGATYDATAAGGAVAGAPGAPGAAPGQPPGPGWWMASDGNWYPPQQTPSAAPGYPPAYGAAYAAAYDPLAKSKLVAGLLGIFLGGFGIHRFYLGYTQMGVIQIIVTVVTCGIGAIWGFIEGILILVGHDSFRTDAEGRPLKE
jgi:TM2 domain-containing membrane protein YozV